MCSVPAKTYRTETAIEIVDRIRRFNSLDDEREVFKMAFKNQAEPRVPDLYEADYLAYWRNLPLTYAVLPGYVRLEDWKIPNGFD